MSLALDLARRGQGLVEPNPMVGCVIVKNGGIVGRGCHRKYGGLHAEPNALRDAGDLAKGATVYVTLEPCNHTGKTPPCTEALIRAGVKRVVAAMKDPNPIVAGKGFRRLRAAGIQVQVGLLHDAATVLNAPFIKYFVERRPYVILKWAQSIDGKIATRTGDSKWITSPESRKAAHALRARVDGIIVGIGTVLADDPDLTARLVRPKRIAARIVLDPDMRIPLNSKLVRTAKAVPTIIAAARPGRSRASGTANRKRRRLELAGCDVLTLPRATSGIGLPALMTALRERQMTNLLVEGGGLVLGSFLQQGLADEARVFVAPRLIGGEEAPGPLRNLGPALMAGLPAIAGCEVTHHGPDICYNIRLG